MAILVNPYVAGNPVGDSPAFVGRADVLREVLRMLRRSQDNAIVLFGQRRIGKTSILQHLAAQLPSEGPYRPVYFDLQDKADWPLERVLKDLARTIAHALGQPDPDLGPDLEAIFRQEWLPAVLNELPDGSSLVLLFDEFDVLADPQEGQAVAAFFPYLRGLLADDPARLQFVFVIGRNVDDLSNIALSLFKGAPAQRVSLLNFPETLLLVRLSQANDTLRWPVDAVRRVRQFTCGHPFLTQQLCSFVWERAYDEESDEPPAVTPEDVDAAVPDALEASRNTLEWLWDGLPPAERVVTSALAEAGPGPITQEGLERLLHESGVRVVIRELQNAPQLLQEWDLIEPADGGYRFRVELLRQWIAEHKPLHRVQEELDRIEPVADSLYRAALGLYRGGQLDQAIRPLRQAVGLNPSHVGANQLLADILLSQGQLGEARQLLEQLYEYHPTAARSRLVQALVAQAQAAESSNELVILYNRMLELDSMPPEVTAELQRTSQRHVQECIVCKEHFSSGTVCPRCGIDNWPWLVQQARAPEEQEGIEGLLAFSAPYSYLPFFITGLALAFGLMGMGVFWKGIVLAARILAVAVTVCLCLIAAVAGYSARHEIREQELLNRVRRGLAALLGSVRFRAIVVPGFSLFLVLLITWAMIVSDLPWMLAKWFFLDPDYLEQGTQLERQGAVSDTTPEEEQPEEEEDKGLRTRIRQVLPFTLMGMYVAFMISFTYSASLQLALLYAQKMNKVLPEPIFLREDLLTKVVQREAARIVGRPITPIVVGGDEIPTRTEQGPRNWTWDEMERTADGGIRLKAIVRAGSKMDETLTGERTERPVYVTYVVEAGPWGRITKVVRMKG